MSSMISDVQSYKVIILGDAGVGKTSLANRQCRNDFSFQMTPTIGTSHMKTIVALGDRSVELRIWDTAGQEQFASLVSMYARGAKVCILVASICDVNSIANLEVWRERLYAAGETPPIIVAINKVDMQNDSLTMDQVREQYGDKYPDMLFVSAKTGDGVAGLFTAAADAAFKADTHESEPERKLEPADGGKPSCC